MLALATAIGKFSVTKKHNDCRDQYIQAVYNGFDEEIPKIRQFLATLCGHAVSNSDEITALTPDLLGELFVIRHFGLLNTNEKREWIKMFVGKKIIHTF